MIVFYVFADVSGNEWRTRYETQVELNGQLERQISLISERLEDIRGNPVGKFSGFQKTLLWKHVHYVAVFSQVFVSNHTIPLCIVWLSFSRSRVVSSAKTLLNTWAQHFQYMKHLWWWCSCKIGNLGRKYFFASFKWLKCMIFQINSLFPFSAINKTRWNISTHLEKFLLFSIMHAHIILKCSCFFCRPTGFYSVVWGHASGECKCSFSLRVCLYQFC